MTSTAIINYNRTVPPEAMIGISEAKGHLKQDSSYEDTQIIAMIKAAGQMAENKTSRAFMQSTWLMTTSDWPDTDLNGFFKLMPAPLISITTVKYYINNVLTTLSSTLYQVDQYAIPGRVKILAPPSVDDRPDAIQITFLAGYGASGDDVTTQQQAVPDDVKAWVKLNMATLYEYRQTIIPGQLQGNISTFADGLIYPYIL
jgi:uncharacterized phiE125 gp8 family phage protein